NNKKLVLRISRQRTSGRNSRACYHARAMIHDASSGDTESQSCLDAEKALAFAEGRLEEEVLSLVEAHVDGCTSCRRLLSHVAEAVRSGSNGAPPAHQGLNLSGAVAGRYVIEGEIGVGGMGIVYEARDPELGRKVALKVIRTERIGGRDAEALLR